MATATAESEEDVFAGVSSSFQDLYVAILFFACLYLAGDVVCRRWLRIVPPLVGQILVGIAFGPEGLNVLPDASSTFVLLGNLGLCLLILQAGLEMDVGILRLIGPRGVWIAIVGSILPIGIGIGLTVGLGYDIKTAIATGACFGPTSAGIAMNVLGQCGVLQKPIGQLIVAAAIVDDMLALIILSQLRALTGYVTVGGIVVPIVSALLWFVVGGAIALYVMPKVTDKLLNYWQRGTNSIKEQSRVGCCLPTSGTDESRPIEALVVMMALLLALLPATFFTQASYLLGAFLAGLSNCRNDMLGAYFLVQFKRVIQWLMRIFFAATIGFQVPVSLFGSGTVIWKGLVLMVSLCGKLAVGPLLTPKLEGKHHWRDCTVVSFSMAGEAEFAFVIAVFGVTNGLIEAELYASAILAILLSTILSPLLLRTTLALIPYDQDALFTAADAQAEKTLNEPTDLSSARFWHIQMKSHASWGSLPQLLQSLLDLDLEIVNHRSWHQRHPSEQDADIIWMWNDIYVVDEIDGDTSPEEDVASLNNCRSEAIKTYIEESSHQKVRIPTIRVARY